ncbi:hypothetical protein OAU81_00350 [bacterium]|nr:hypothetical protein [bacterium]
MNEEKEILQECYDQLIVVNESLHDIPRAKKINDRLDRMIRSLSEMIEGEDDDDSWN